MEESRWKITDIEVPFKCVVLWWIKQAPLLILLSLIIVFANYVLVTRVMGYEIQQAVKQVMAEVDKAIKGEPPPGGKPNNSDYWKRN
jgi:hypothetical protein